MRKTKDLLKKIRGTQGNFHANMGTIKDRNSKDLIETEEIKKRWQEYTQELYKKTLNDPDNHDGVVTHLEPDILECEVKWTLGSIQFSSVQFSSVIQSCLTLRDPMDCNMPGFSVLHHLPELAQTPVH